MTTRFLRDLVPRGESRTAYIFTMVCYTLAIDLLGGRVADVLGLWRTRQSPGAISNARQMTTGPWWNHAVLDLLISPIVESLAIVGIIEGLRRLKISAPTAVAVATLLFSALHGLTIPIWGLICLPGFFIQAASYVYWRRASFWTGLQVIVLIHALSNLPPFLHTVGSK